MKKVFSLWCFVWATALCLLCSCNSDDDGVDGPRNAKNVAGLWYCVYQEWTQDGETETKTYTPSGEYCICFDEDGSGYMRSGSDELFEIGTHGTTYTFKWKQTGNKVYTNVYDGEVYTIVSLKGKMLTMLWNDDDYTIICKFERQDD